MKKQTSVPDSFQIQNTTKMYSVDIMYGQGMLMTATLRAVDKEGAQLEVMKKLKFIVKELKNGE